MKDNIIVFMLEDEQQIVKKLFKDTSIPLKYERGKRPFPEKIKCDILDIFNNINNCRL